MTDPPPPHRWPRRAILLANALVTPLMLSAHGHRTPARRAVTIAAWTFLRTALVAGTMLPNSGALGPVIRRFPARGRDLWLTLDDGPDPRSTPALLDLLDEFDARATFFLIGQKAAACPALTREIAARGHQLGNHTQTHPAVTLWAASPRVLEREVATAARTIADLAGVRPRFFRSPAGLTSPLLHDILHRHGCRRVGWTARGYDGLRRSDGSSVDRILKNLSPGGIVLFHGEGRTATTGPERLRTLLTRLRHAGFRCVLPFPDRTPAG